jgi:hypothetical protein
MKNLKLFVVAAIATVAFASCGGGASDKPVDSAKVDTVKAAAPDTTPVAAPDTTMKKDSAK